MKEIKKFVIETLVLLVICYSQLATAAKPNPTLFPIDSYPYGKSYGVWGQEFTRWVYQFSLADYPLFQGDGPADCSISQSGQVWFLYGVLDGAVSRSCTIPPGKSIFIAVNATTSFVPLFGETEAEIRADAQRDLAGVSTLEVTIDGISLADPFAYRANSPDGGFVFSIEEGSILTEFGIPADEYAPAIVDGYWIMLPPLSVGEHEIRWASSGVFQDGSPYSYDATWLITVGK